MREQRLVFGEEAELYDKARPGYPARLIDDVVALVGPSAWALDVGCGTGKAAVLLAGRGLGGMGVEPDPAMAEIAERNLAPYGNWHVEVDDFEKWRPSSGTRPFDVICSAQAWYWVDPAIRLHKARALLRDGGWLALWWNNLQPDAGEDAAEAQLSRRIDEVYQELAPHLARKSDMSHRCDHVDGLGPEVGFGHPISNHYHWDHEYTADTWVALLRTHSHHRLLAGPVFDQLAGRIHDIVIDAGGSYRQHYVCCFWAAQRTDR